MVIDVRAEEPAYVHLDHDSTVKYARIRVVGDTLYGWEYAENRAARDSVAISLRRVIAIEQNRLDVAQTVGAVIAGVAGVVCVGIVALLFMLQADHS